jgi:protein-S-isoprenylcysteine O-methyltransferase Ste14
MSSVCFLLLFSLQPQHLESFSFPVHSHKSTPPLSVFCFCFCFLFCFYVFFVCLFCFVLFLQSWYFISLCTLGHELVWNGPQQLFSISPHKVCFSGWRRLALQLHPCALLFGFLFLLVVLLHSLQEAVPAL